MARSPNGRVIGQRLLVTRSATARPPGATARRSRGRPLTRGKPDGGNEEIRRERKTRRKKLRRKTPVAGKTLLDVSPLFTGEPRNRTYVNDRPSSEKGCRPRYNVPVLLRPGSQRAPVSAHQVLTATLVATGVHRRRAELSGAHRHRIVRETPATAHSEHA